MTLFISIARMFERAPEWPGALQQLSENPSAMAEVLVLFRMVLAGGVVHSSQLTAFERICKQHFSINPRDMPDLHLLLDSPQAQSCDAKAFMLLSQLDTDERRALLDDMMRIARANSIVDAGEDRLIRQIAVLLGLEPGTAFDEKGVNND